MLVVEVGVVVALLDDAGHDELALGDEGLKRRVGSLVKFGGFGIGFESDSGKFVRNSADRDMIFGLHQLLATISRSIMIVT